MRNVSFNPFAAALAAIFIAMFGTTAQADPASSPFDVAMVDGEDFVIGRTGKTPQFEATLASSTLTGREAGIRRE